ncbi:restriction endonuclease subunit S [Rhodoferax sp. TBRC 17660]|uniref:Restriction endonuclease subunit S n=1 Tax=Rhodoferax potami TaxID=3068338 RepID=A0ABU3KN09_9BURK|nr:restriction endonuclease subunit S [Rhodoferax sp. TBRC 17660]MDT7518812.1 restriction endonuclease subunit S [Rhodoferax sp. TBRC 17660]
MSNRDKAALVPKLRFPEFRGALDWKETRLGQLGELVSGLTYSPDDVRETGLLVLRSSNVQNGKIALDDCVYVDPATKGANLSQANDILICVRNGSVALIGKNALIPEGMPLCTHGAFMTVFRSKSAKFVFQLFQSDKYQKQVAGDLGATINSINGGQLVKYTFAVPQPSEQQKIADCLSSLDELIAAQARKVDALKTHKKGLIQQLFPREGETQPRLRFPEFRDTGEWEWVELGEKVDFLSGYPFDGPDISQDSSGIPLLRGINVTEGRIRHNSEIDRYYIGSTEGLEKYRLQVNDLVIGMDGSKVGKNSALVSETDVGALLIQRVARLRANKVPLIQFIFQRVHSPSFHAYVDRINTSSGIPHISAKQIKEFRICFPSDEEQQRIADCLTSLDALITAAIQELDTLKTHKKGLMQQLFPSAEAAEA